MNYELLQGDCLEIMPTLAEQSIDAIIVPIMSRLRSSSHNSISGMSNSLRDAIFFWYISSVRRCDAWIGPLGYERGSACQYVPFTSTAVPSSSDVGDTSSGD